MRETIWKIPFFEDTKVGEGIFLEEISAGYY